jgi:hypothetical protein
MGNYAKSFDDYLSEQAIPFGAPAEGAPKKEKVYSFLFIEDDEKPTKKYPDGSKSKDFYSYSVTEPDLKKWADTNIVASKGEGISDATLSAKRENLIKIVTGEKSDTSKDDEKYLVALKGAVAIGSLGKKGPTKTVTFQKEEPLIDDVDITFIKIKREK